jgi:pyrimidine deaminase RibD-like protein
MSDHEALKMMPDLRPLSIAAGDHRAYMYHALSLACRSPPKPTNYRVGALILDPTTNNILATGYTLELQGNTHAEQCCLIKISNMYGVTEEMLGDVLPPTIVLYTTVEPCGKRLSGNLPCVERILRLRKVIKTVYVGVKEPEKFVGENVGRSKLEQAGIEVVLIEGMEEEILKVATAGHTQE